MPIHHHRRLFLILILLVALTGLLFIGQIRRALSIVTEKNPEPIISNEIFDIPISTADPILGNPGAALTLVEFGDLTTKRGRATHATIAAFIKAHPREARLVWKHFPEQGIFSNSDLIHYAALCAGVEQKFWVYADSIVAHDDTPDADALNAFASAAKLNAARLSTCAASDATKKKVADDRTLAQTLGLKTPPGLFINNKRINLNKDIDLGQLLETLIEKK